MSRFYDEWCGKLGEFWYAHSHDEVRQLVARMSEIEIEEDGAAKWKSNGAYLPADVVEKLYVYGKVDSFSPEATNAKRERQTEETLNRYRNRSTVGPEEIGEMKAAFGEGTIVVDIITGRKYVL